MEAPDAAAPSKPFRDDGQDAEGGMKRLTSVSSGTTTRAPGTATPALSSTRSPSTPERGNARIADGIGLTDEMSLSQRESFLSRQASPLGSAASAGGCGSACCEERRASRAAGAPAVIPAELRRSKYVVPEAQKPPRHVRLPRAAQGPSGGASPGCWSRGAEFCALAAATACDADTVWDTVLIEGPMQECCFLAFWVWRWCVLVRVRNRWELRVYADEASSLSSPGHPMQRHVVADLAVRLCPTRPAVLVLEERASREPRRWLRSGPGQRWEELASSALWSEALRSARAPRRLSDCRPEE